MTQIKLDSSLFPQAKKNGNGNGNGFTVTQVETKEQIVDSGVAKMYVDVHEPEEIVEMLRKEKGIVVEVKALASGDFAWSNIGIERKTIQDFYNSIVHGDKHIWKQMFNLKHAFERPVLVIERWDENFMASKQIERTVYATMAHIFLMGIHVITLPGHGKNIRPLVELLAYLFFASDKKALSMRPVTEKCKSMKKDDVLSDVISMIPMIGRKQADVIAKHINSIEDLVKMSDDDLKKLGLSLGKERLNAMRWVLNGKEWERAKVRGTRSEDKKGSTASQ
jgi:ERCC4-type nuclease